MARIFWFVLGFLTCGGLVVGALLSIFAMIVRDLNQNMLDFDCFEEI